MHGREKMSTKDTGHDQLPPTWQQFVISPNFRKQSCKGGRLLSRQDICQRMAATDGSLTAQRNTENLREMIATRNIVYDQLTTHQQPMMSQRLKQR